MLPALTNRCCALMQEKRASVRSDLLLGAPFDGTVGSAYSGPISLLAWNAAEGPWDYAHPSKNHYSSMLNYYDSRPYDAVIPMIGLSRKALRRRIAADNGFKKPTANDSELVGDVTSSLIPAALGASLGHYFGGSQGVGIGGLVGGLGSILGGNIIGTLKAISQDTRTKEEQAEYEASNKWKNWLIPGMATYNRARSIIAADNYKNDPKKKKKKKD